MHVPAPGCVQMFAVLSIWYVDFADFIKGEWKAPFLCWLFCVYLSSHALPANLVRFAIRISSGWVNVNVLMDPLVEISPQMGKAYCREKSAVCDVDRQTVQLQILKQTRSFDRKETQLHFSSQVYYELLWYSPKWVISFWSCKNTETSL